MTGRERGFTLLEALIAFAIGAMALGVLFEGASTALRTTDSANRLEGGVERATSHLAEAGVLLGGSGERVETGQDGAYRYRVTITPLPAGKVSRAAIGGPAVVNAVRLYRLVVEESWSERGRDRTFRLETKRLFVAPAA